MNIVLSALAGGILGWAAFAYLGYNEGRGKVVAIVIGVIGGVLGGEMVAPMFTAGTVATGFDTSGLIYAAVVAAVFITVGNLVYKHWGV